MFQKTTLVIGATGKTGRSVAERLKAWNLPMRIGSRSGQLPFDWADPATWAPGVRDVAAVYVTYYRDLAAPGASDAILSFTGRAVKSGVQRLVLLSARGEPEAQVCELTGHYLWTFAQAIGRPPRDIADYVRETATTGVWHAGPQS